MVEKPEEEMAGRQYTEVKWYRMSLEQDGESTSNGSHKRNRLTGNTQRRDNLARRGRTGALSPRGRRESAIT